MNNPCLKFFIDTKLDIASDNQLREHKIAPLVFSYTQNEKLKADWLLQWQRNEVLIEQLNYLTQNIAGLICLKGAALIGDIYTPHQRHLSDLDFLVKRKNLNTVRKKILELGYTEINTNKWSANNFKALFCKNINGVDVMLEIHTRLFFQENKIMWDTQTRNGKLVLILEDQLIHLMGHLGYQHTYLALYWLFDIMAFMDKYQGQLNWGVIARKMEKLNQKRVFKSFMWLAENYFNIELCPRAKIYYPNQKYYGNLFSLDFLLSPTKKPWHYYLVKHFTKDKFSDALKYDFLWAKNKVEQRLNQWK